MYYYTLPSVEETHIRIHVIINRYSNTSDIILPFFFLIRLINILLQKKNRIYYGCIFTKKLLKQVYVAPRLKSSRKKILWSSSPSGWPFRNIHNSNSNGSFTFYVDVFFPLSLPKLLPDLTVYISNTATVF